MGHHTMLAWVGAAVALVAPGSLADGFALPGPAVSWVTQLPPVVPAIPAYPGNGGIAREPWGFSIFNDLIQVDLVVGPGIGWRGVASACMVGQELAMEPGPVFAVRLGAEWVGSDRVAVGDCSLRQEGDVSILVVPWDGRPAGLPVLGTLGVSVGEDDAVRFRLDISHAGDAAVHAGLEFPLLRGLRIGSADGTWCFHPERGGLGIRLAPDVEARRGPDFPLQVMGVFSAAGGGLSVGTESDALEDGVWGMRKTDFGVDMGIRREIGALSPGQSTRLAPLVLRAHTGDWRRAFGLYREWLQNRQPAQHGRAEWASRVFAGLGVTPSEARGAADSGDLAAVLTSGRRRLGRVDYLHVVGSGSGNSAEGVAERFPHDLAAAAIDLALCPPASTGSSAVGRGIPVDFLRFAAPRLRLLRRLDEPALRGENWNAVANPLFNGEGYWIAAADARAVDETVERFLQRAVEILHAHAEAFGSAAVEPLVETASPTLLANRFGAVPGTVVWTVLNTGSGSHEGPVLRLRHRRGTVYREAFAAVEIVPEIAKGTAVLSLSLPPGGMACVVAAPENP